jgi:hypothetical protein
MIPSLGTIVLAAAVVAGVRWCGAKFLLLFPATAIAMLVGVIGDAVVWERAGGRYEDSDTIIFGLPRVEGSAANWYRPTSDDQYAGTSRLDARAALHQRLSTSSV